MESSCIPGEINISESTFKLIGHKFNCTCRGNITTKGKKKMKMYFVESKK
jgi:hypothetical protein